MYAAQLLLLILLLSILLNQLFPGVTVAWFPIKTGTVRNATVKVGHSEEI